MGGTPDEVLNDATFMNILVPRLRADFRLAENYQYHHGTKIQCSATVFCGENDTLAEAEHMSQWSELVTGETKVHNIRWGHFFLHSHTDEVLQLIRNCLEELSYPVME